MTIIGLQRRLVEVGRIRMGEKGERGNPKRLENWKLTSRDQLRLTAAAKVFGGDVREWEGHAGQYELHTEVDSLPILLMPGQAISQHYELWSGGGCKRRCDGENEQLSDGACMCDPDARECKPHTRLNVLLPDVAGIGCWRLDTQGYYAATELAGTVDLLEIATMRGVLLPARLRIDQRAVLRNGQTRRFPVPTLDIDVRPLEMQAITQAAHEGEVAPLPDGYRPVAELSAGGTTLEAGLAGAAAQAEPAQRTGRSAEPISDDVDIEGDAELTADEEMQTFMEDADQSVASADQQRLIMARAREHGWNDKDRYTITERICGDGITSVKKVPKSKVDALLRALELGPAILELVQEADEAKDDIDLGTPTDPLEELRGQLMDYGNSLDMGHQVAAAIATHRDEEEWLTRQLARLKGRYEETKGAA
jgi:hypothetical protein